MLLLELNGVTKYFGERLILRLDQLKVYTNDKIGIVGVNGSGKTTLLNILAGRTAPDSGIVKRYRECSYITQLGVPEMVNNCNIDRVLAQRFNLNGDYKDFMSGGEKTKYKIIEALSKQNSILLADEPTANIDISGIQLLEGELVKYRGALLVVSHDRSLLDKVCSKILEIENGSVEIYHGNYSFYLKEKMAGNNRKEFEYRQYVKEKRKLELARLEKEQQSKTIRKTPKRMGNSEARLHKMGNQKAKANLDKAVKAIESRMQRLEVKERPGVLRRMELDLPTYQALHSKLLIQGKNLTKGFGNKILFNDVSFEIYRTQKTAIVGNNGCGKTTLLKMILNGYEGIKVAQQVKFGYFSQDLDILKNSFTVLENVMECSIYPEGLARTILSRLLIKGNDIHKNVTVLSGGERVRVALAKMLLSDINFIILDEPTNYLDIASMEAMEEALSLYRGNLLFVSHDRKFINSVATNVIIINQGKLEMFEGNYEEYLQSKEVRSDCSDKLLLQYRLAEVLGKLSMPTKQTDLEKLKDEYDNIMSQLERDNF